MRRRFASVNSFGMSTRWSDGYTDIPMVSLTSRLAYCPGCNKIYWLEDATELGVVPTADEREKNRAGWLTGSFGKKASVSATENVAQVDLLDLDFVDYHQHPRPADLHLAVLREEWSNPERELYLRTRLWWIGGHGQRGRRMASPMSDKQAKENMLCLLVLHQAVPVPDQDAAGIAELLRQFGQFDKAIAALEGVCGDSRRVHAIKDAAARGDSHLFEVETF